MRLLSLLITILQGCGHAGSKHAVSTPNSDSEKTSVHSGIAADDDSRQERLMTSQSVLPIELNGTLWTPNESARDRLTVARPCFSDPDLVRFGSDGEQITLTRTFYAPPSGVPHRMAWEQAKGRWENERLILMGTHRPYQRPPEEKPDEPTNYQLHLEAESGNLVGTRNGVAIRLVPAKLVERTQPCPSPPPQAAPRR